MDKVSGLGLALAIAFAGGVFSPNVAAQAPVSSVTGSGDLEQRVARLERLLEARGEQAARLSQQLSHLQQEVSELRGISEGHAHQLNEVLERQRDLYQEIDRRMGDVRNGGSGSEPVSVPTRNSGTGTVAGGITADTYSTNLSENEAYDRAIALVLEECRYDDAIPEFRKFIEAYPNSGYLGNAHYWLGQLLYSRNDYADAQRHFREVVDNYPDSSKRADCLLKLGIISQSENNLDNARTRYRQVVDQYPDSTEAGLARARLERL